METITKPFLLKFVFFANYKEACVFMKRVVGYIRYGEDSAKNSGSKNLDFIGIGVFRRNPEFCAI